MKPAISNILIVGLGLIPFAVLLVATAWICDDAYFSFRPVDNVVHGYGLTWNPIERVQSFTNPLWTLLLVPIHFVYSEIFYTAIFLSILLSLATLYLILTRHAVAPTAAALVVLLALLCKPFVDYSTSGLENPLNHLLVAIFFTVYFLQAWNTRTLFHLVLIASLGVVTRLDTLLLYLPALGLVLWRVRSLAAVKAIAFGILPVVAWELFSLIYYGFPFPNTYYAKLSTGIAAGALRLQGLYYVAESAMSHPLVVLALAAAVVLPVIRRDYRALAAASGIVVYTLYVINVGGDFMSGRFFTVPLVIAMIVLARQPWPTLKRGSVLLAMVLIVGLIQPGWSLFGTDSTGTHRAASWHGITDERGWYSPETSLIDNLGSNAPNHHEQAISGREARDNDSLTVMLAVNGMVGYYAGPQKTSVGLDGLSDPLLSRLPTVDPIEWRIGHFQRLIPLGYHNTLLDGRNEIFDSNLARYYEHLCAVTRGDLFAPGRLSEIIRFNAGTYNSLVERYVDAPQIAVHYEDFRAPKQSGLPWAWLGNMIIKSNGMSVLLDSAVHCGKVELSLDDDDQYRVAFLRQGAERAGVIIKDDPRPHQGMRLCEITLPADLVTVGYDQIKITPVSGDGRYSVGHLRLLDPAV